MRLDIYMLCWSDQIKRCTLFRPVQMPLSICGIRVQINVGSSGRFLRLFKFVACWVRIQFWPCRTPFQPAAIKTVLLVDNSIPCFDVCTGNCAHERMQSPLFRYVLIKKLLCIIPSWIYSMIGNWTEEQNSITRTRGLESSSDYNFKKLSKHSNENCKNLDWLTLRCSKENIQIWMHAPERSAHL